MRLGSLWLCVVLIGSGALAACRVSPDSGLLFDEDGGARLDCAAADGGCRGFDAALPEEDGEHDGNLDACEALLTKACGAAGGLSCEGEPGCRAAELLALYEPGSCSAALENEQSYPPCEASVCEVLVNKVCGPGGASGPCAGRPACGPALELHDRAEAATRQADRNAAEDACDAALEDETVFAACAL